MKRIICLFFIVCLVGTAGFPTASVAAETLKPVCLTGSCTAETFDDGTPQETAQQGQENASQEEENCPVVFIPGVMGSSLYSGSRKIWSPGVMELFDPFFYLNDRMKMENSLKVYNDIRDEEGVRHPIDQALLAKGSREYGAEDTYEKLIDGLVEGFTDENGVCSRSIYFFSYDFRQSSMETAKKLNAYILRILREHPEQNRVDIVAHSMGGLVTCAYVCTYGEKQVRRIITAGTPYEGAPKLFYSVLTTNVTGDRTTNLALFLLGGLSRSVKADFPSMAELAPTRQYYRAHHTLFQEASQAEEAYRTLSVRECKKKNRSIFGKNASAARSFHDSIRDASGCNVLADMEQTYFLIGINQKTISGIIFDSDAADSEIAVKAVTYEMTGDGTVPYDSATMMGRLDELPKERVCKLAGSHTGILLQQEGIRWILDVLKKPETITEAAKAVDFECLLYERAIYCAS